MQDKGERGIDIKYRDRKVKKNYHKNAKVRKRSRMKKFLSFIIFFGLSITPFVIFGQGSENDA